MASVAEEMSSNGSAALLKGDPTRPVVAGNYEIDFDDPIGSGGMAVVYRGRDLRSRRPVALKTLRAEYRRDPEARARFRREARTMAFLAHPNVVRVYDLFEDDEAPWAVMEFAPGRSLKEEIAARGPYTVEETTKILDQTAKALDHLHDRGLVHLDVKPQNLIVTHDLSVKLIDFGLAQRAGAPQEMIGGSAFGTAAYLSPEQACGEPVEAATDVYALGCVVYEMLTGQPPFGADPQRPLKNDIIRAHLEHEPEPPSSIRPLPGWVDDAVMTALAKKPQERYQSCSAFARVFWEAIDIPDAPAAAASLTTTARIATPPMLATYDEIFPAKPRRSHPVTGPLYQTSGKLARRAGALRPFLWRSTLALFIGNILLALILYVDRGEVPGVFGNGPVLQAGATAEVRAEGLRLRAEPGREAGVLGHLSEGQEIDVLGGAEVVAGERWWPVRAEIDGRDLEGYVAGGWIEATSGPGDAWLNRVLDWLRGLPGRAANSIY